MRRRGEDEPLRRLGGEPEPVRLYRCLVGGVHRFHETPPGETVDLLLTESQVEGHVASGVVAEYELVGEDSGSSVPEEDFVDLEHDHGPVESLRVGDAAVVFVNDDEDEPDLGLADEGN